MLLALDYGKKRIGLAVGEKIAFSRGFLVNDGEIIHRLLHLIRDENIKIVVIGLPEKDSGQEGELGQEIRGFADRLKKTADIKIVFENESDTTFASHQKLISAGVNIKDSKKEVDGLAAAEILEQFLRNCSKKQ